MYGQILLDGSVEDCYTVSSDRLGVFEQEPTPYLRQALVDYDVSGG
jgi:hypothetical protein